MTSRSRNPEVYVKGYGKNIAKEDLKSWFREFGKIICIQYKGPYSFIVLFCLIQEFEDYYDAEAAVKEMHDKKMQGYRLVVEPSGKKRNRSRSRSHSRRKNRFHGRRYFWDYFSDSSSYSSYSSSSRSSSSSSSSRSSESSSSVSNSYSNNS